jgi:hypothetical protein
LKFAWKCLKCNSAQTSDTEQRHKMDWCKCGSVGVDADKYCTRIAGDRKIYKELGIVKDYNELTE